MSPSTAPSYVEDSNPGSLAPESGILPPSHGAYVIVSLIFVSPLISEHVILSFKFKFNIFLTIACFAVGFALTSLSCFANIHVCHPHVIFQSTYKLNTLLMVGTNMS